MNITNEKLELFSEVKSGPFSSSYNQLNSEGKENRKVNITKMK